MFPSPRGVELHKPDSTVYVYRGSLLEFPSPRGVELHKPAGYTSEWQDVVKIVSVPSRG